MEEDYEQLSREIEFYYSEEEQLNELDFED